MNASDMMIFSQVWQQLMLLSMQPMAWVITPPAEQAPAKSPPPPRRAKARRR